MIFLYLQALNLAGPTSNQPVLSLLAAHHLDTQLYILSNFKTHLISCLAKIK